MMSALFRYDPEKTGQHAQRNSQAGCSSCMVLIHTAKPCQFAEKAYYQAFYDRNFTKDPRFDWCEVPDRITPFLDKNLSPVSCAPFLCRWHTERMACYSSHFNDIASSSWGECETSFVLWGQDPAFLVHVFLRRKRRYPYWQSFSAILTWQAKDESLSSLAHQTDWKPYVKMWSWNVLIAAIFGRIDRKLPTQTTWRKPDSLLNETLKHAALRVRSWRKEVCSYVNPPLADTTTIPCIPL